MTLNTIFTGHTLDLMDIVAIGPPMSIKQGRAATLYLEIHLHSSEKIKFIACEVADFEYEQNRWDKALDDLIDKRDGLLADWQRARYNLTLMQTEDPQVDYQRTEVQHNDRISPIITEFWNT
ncbi:hypothetical protein GVN20_05580 [Runella sp. CRIBMP]|uniref:hypothetical protein n=1 Tax=Runella sp. CRIBMP TaxID=2683261 RepID=UPI00141272C0|nr:hypothetical protein [Runella sp. CRIBMP]NBB18820.1 hypothetical protein [Runella sp. CRIBMP]